MPCKLMDLFIQNHNKYTGVTGTTSLTQILFEWRRDSKKCCNTLPEPIAQEGLKADRALFLSYHSCIYYYWYL